MAPASEKEKKKKAPPKKIAQQTIFSLPGHDVVVKKMKKTSKNTIVEVDSFVRKENPPSKSSNAGVFKFRCACLKEFKTSQGFGGHRVNCEVAIQLET